jgi:hypothetical protein
VTKLSHYDTSPENHFMKVLWARKFATVAEEKLYAKQIVCGGRVTAGHGHKVRSKTENVHSGACAIGQVHGRLRSKFACFIDN